MELRKNDTVTVTIEDMGHDGAGIGKIDGYPLFIKDALIGDEVTAKIMKTKKNYAFARLIEVKKPSAHRVEPKCRFARQCGGCQIQALDYQEQLRYKKNKVMNNLTRIGGLEEIPMDEIIGMEVPFYYRNKAQFPVGTDKDGRIITGFYAGRTHSIISNRQCCLGADVNEKVLDKVMTFMEENHVSAYDEETGSGLVRHVLIRYGFFTKEVMVCLIVNGSSLPEVQKLIVSLCEIEGMTSITLNVNRKNTNVIMGEEIKLLWGQAFISDYIGDVQYRVSPLSFYQVNPLQTKRMYEKALEYAQLTGEETVWDLYCGIGTISLFLAGKAKQVYGVEIVPQAIDDARNNAKMNGIGNVQFYVGKAEEILPKQYEIDGVYADVIVVDPPRKGCDESLLHTMVVMAPERIVYVSCDSATLARDLKWLCERGYELEKVSVIDNFCQTVHVETVALLTRKKDVERIHIEMNVDKEDVTEKATYQKIKDYVKEKYGVNVHTKYIAEVKRKHGLPMHDAPNKIDVPKREYPDCPEEKAKAIEEALKYFGIIK